MDGCHIDCATKSTQTENVCPGLPKTVLPNNAWGLPKNCLSAFVVRSIKHKQDILTDLLLSVSHKLCHGDQGEAKKLVTRTLEILCGSSDGITTKLDTRVRTF